MPHDVVKHYANRKANTILAAGTLLSARQRGPRMAEKRLPESSDTEKIVTKKTAHVLGKIQEHHPATNGRHDKRLAVHLVGGMDEIHGQRKVRHVVRPTHCWRESHAIFRRPLSHTTREPVVHQGNPGAFRSPISQQILRTVHAKRDLPYRACEEREKVEGLVPGVFEANKGRQAVFFAHVNPMNKNKTKCTRRANT